MNETEFTQRKHAHTLSKIERLNPHDLSPIFLRTSFTVRSNPRIDFDLGETNIFGIYCC